MRHPWCPISGTTNVAILFLPVCPPSFLPSNRLLLCLAFFVWPSLFSLLCLGLRFSIYSLCCLWLPFNFFNSLCNLFSSFIHFLPIQTYCRAVSLRISFRKHFIFPNGLLTFIIKIVPFLFFPCASWTFAISFSIFLVFQILIFDLLQNSFDYYQELLGM